MSWSVASPDKSESNSLKPQNQLLITLPDGAQANEIDPISATHSQSFAPPLSSQICNMQEGKLSQGGARTPCVTENQIRNHALGFDFSV